MTHYTLPQNSVTTMFDFVSNDIGTDANECGIAALQLEQGSIKTMMGIELQ